jgi:hypothetical protein
MQLLAQDFGDILSALRAAEDASGHERRISTRMDVQAQVKVVPFENGRPIAEPFTCMTRDLCFKGIGLLQSTQPARGSQFVVTLPKPNGESMSVLCTVMYCRALADGIYNVGATFNRICEPNAGPAVAIGGGAGGGSGGGGGSGSGGRSAAQPNPAKPGTPANAHELDRIRQSILR